MKTIARKLALLLILGLLAAPVRCTVAAANPADNDPNAPPSPPAATEVLEKSGEGNETETATPERELVLVGKDAVVKPGETRSEVVVVRGNATIDGTVSGDVVVIAGSAKVTGQVGGNLVVVLGSADLSSTAEVKHDTVVVGGPIQAEPGAKLDGARQEIGIGMGLRPFDAMHGWLGRGLFHGRLLPPAHGWWWLVAGVFLALYLVVALLFPRPVHACVQAIETRPVASICSGVLAFVLVVPVLLLLAVTGVGLLIVPFAICAIIVVAVLGKVTVYQCTGLQLGRQFGSASLQKPLLALVVGTVLFYVLYTIPILSLILWGIIAPLGVGAVLMALFSASRKEGKTNGTTPGTPMAAIPTANLAPPGAAPPATNLAVTTPTPPAGVSSASVPPGVPPVLPGAAATAAPPPPLATPPAPAGPPVIGETLLLPRAGFWIRLCAVVLDALLVGGAIKLTNLHDVFLPIWLVYHVGMWTWRGTTIGGVVMGIKIFRRDGRPLDFGVALIRSLASFFSFFVFCLGFLWVGWDREKQSWHDKIAGTIMVRMPKGLSLI